MKSALKSMIVAVLLAWTISVVSAEAADAANYCSTKGKIDYDARSAMMSDDSCSTLKMQVRYNDPVGNLYFGLIKTDASGPSFYLWDNYYPAYMNAFRSCSWTYGAPVVCTDTVATSSAWRGYSTYQVYVP